MAEIRLSKIARQFNIGLGTLIDFLNDLKILESRGMLLDFDYEMMKKDLANIAKLFKYYYDKCQGARK